ncbi:PREDICTED: transmembrane protein 116-like isoform X4 [Branchiostoma belcheri]|uniref:Transmembrane protein 116-like isoform X1 n=1 Tax=Branchiostoma belcheri TaxID=7741 RepID=A0A6P4ZP75_BRABE|nr:PREDICTED: transmembrane protein 116-like isoform X1 [Branchiostoma belcheri]XP_019631465.1 PREDICTED: transmembrane protein 116-like isoform X2 [Branchiostoma belcheri]XP_019631466.1 PREDICTED: transmembrane protein 116-like isoform X3 [Branchiostoma belcheri]XP_019631467.1 PREDICTED: transmembrane protein 116-like isoform X4 [Branchiostoma belcheri]
MDPTTPDMTTARGTSESDGCTAEDMKNMEALSYIHMIMSAISILATLSIILYSIIKKIFRSAEVRPLFHLAVADLLLAACWLVGSLLWRLDGDHAPDNDSCFYLQLVTEAVHLVTFFLTMNYALNVYVRLKDRENKADNLSLLMSTRWMVWTMRLVYVLSWFVPVLIMIPPALHKKQVVKDVDTCTRCLMPFGRSSTGKYLDWNSYSSLVLVGCLVLSISAMVVLYVLSYRVYGRVLKSNIWTNAQRDALGLLKTRVTLYILVFLFCWSPALTVAITDLSQEKFPEFSRYVVLYILQGVTAPAQGFLNSLVYGWTRSGFREAMRDNIAATSTSPQTPLLLARSNVIHYGSSGRSSPTTPPPGVLSFRTSFNETHPPGRPARQTLIKQSV